MHIDFALKVAALVLFILAASNISPMRLVGAGLACLTLTLLL